MSNLFVTTTVNGDTAEFICEPGETLLDALRWLLQLTGSNVVYLIINDYMAEIYNHIGLYMFICICLIINDYTYMCVQ